jgi:hypothetical protein
LFASEEVKSEMGPYCRQYKEYLPSASSFFFLLTLGPIHLFEKKIDDAQTKNLGVVMHGFGHAQTRHKIKKDP